MNIKFSRKLILWLGRLLMLLSFVYLGNAIRAQASGFHGIVFNAAAILSLAALVLFYFSQWIVGASIWRCLLHGGNVYISLRKSFIILGQAQIAKYLPGNVFQYVGRFALSARHAVPAAAVAGTTVIEIILCVVSSALMASPEIIIAPDSISKWMPAINRNIIFALMIAAVIIGIGILAGAIASGRARKWAVSQQAYLKPSRLIYGIGQFLFIFAVMGILTWLLAHMAFNTNSTLPWYRYAGRITFAWLIGFVAPGAPGGLGIREAITVKMFEDELGEGVALCIALTMRLCNIIGDLLVFLVAWLFAMKSEDNSKTQDTTLSISR
jgi:hypothetical protein